MQVLYHQQYGGTDRTGIRFVWDPDPGPRLYWQRPVSLDANVAAGRDLENI